MIEKDEEYLRILNHVQKYGMLLKFFNKDFCMDILKRAELGYVKETDEFIIIATASFDDLKVRYFPFIYNGLFVETKHDRY